MGGEVSRICVVDDVPQEIVGELHAAMQHGTTVICTTGGLGPTFDDRTLESIAQAVGLPLVRHEAAYAFVAETYRRLHAEGAVTHSDMVPSREKMALLPQGAEMLPNLNGSAPGMLLRWRQHVIIAMPGPPSEMRPMFESSVAPLLRSRWEGWHRLEIAVQTDVADESLLNPLFERIMASVAGSHESRSQRFWPRGTAGGIYHWGGRQRGGGTHHRPTGEPSAQGCSGGPGMGWRQRSEDGWDRIVAEHVIMVPETHGLTVDDQVMLHPLGRARSSAYRTMSALSAW